MVKRKSPFTAATLGFLEELRDNNDREWFQENKARYEALVLDPALSFIESMYEPLQALAPAFTAIPKRSGGSLMRVYRDTRFSRDKTPYKTNIGIQFRHELGKDAHAPGYYLHIEPGQAFVGAGMWRPPADALLKVRQRIADEPAAWRRAVADRGFRRHYELAGESLKRPPRGFDKAHELIDDIKRKDFIGVRELDVAAVVADGFQRKVLRSIEAAEPLMRFLCRAVGAPF